MNRLGIIYEIQGIKAVVLTSEGEFLIIRRRKDMKVGQQVSFEMRIYIMSGERDFYMLLPPFQVLRQCWL